MSSQSESKSNEFIRSRIFRNRFFIYLYVFIFPPLGLYLLFKYRPQTSVKKKLTAVFIGTIWLLLVSAIVSTGGSSDTTQSTNGSETPASSTAAEPETDWIGFMENAKSNIKRGLKSPSTAEFPGSLFDPYDGWKRDKIGDTINLESYVDSQNSYGAMVRSYFTIKYNNLDDTKYHPFYIELDGNVLKNDS